MTIKDIEEYKRNVIEILRENHQYATAKATEEAFDLLIERKKTIDTWNKILEIAPLYCRNWSLEDAFNRLKP